MILQTRFQNICYFIYMHVLVTVTFTYFVKKVILTNPVENSVPRILFLKILGVFLIFL